MTKPNKQMNHLITLLAQEGIPFEVTVQAFDGVPSIQICTPNVEDCVIDAISHNYSYGGDAGLIEIMCQYDDDVFGYLTSAEAFEHFKEAWRRKYSEIKQNIKNSQ